jgi:hypothetical protein
MSPRQLEILQHSLGVDQYGQGRMYRNHFCAGEDDETICRELVALGYMKTFTRSYLPYYNCTVTEAGKAAMLAQSPKPPKLTRGQERYRRFLRADSGLSFREWLKWYAGDRSDTPRGATSSRDVTAASERGEG